MSKSKPVDFDSLPDTAYLRLNQLVPHVIPICASSVWAKVREHKFPKPQKFGPKTTCWNVGQIRDYLKNPDQEFA